MPRGVPGNVPPSGNASGRAAFAMSMRRLAEVESWPIYAELCREAEVRALGESLAVRGGNGKLMEATG